MKSLFLTFLVSCLVALVISNHHAEETEHEHEAIDACYKDLKLKAHEDFEELIRANSPKTQCFGKCVYEKMLHGKEKKPIDYASLVAFYKKDYQDEMKIYEYAAKNIEKCKEAAAKGKDDCEKANKFAICDWDLFQEAHKKA